MARAKRAGVAGRRGTVAAGRGPGMAPGEAFPSGRWQAPGGSPGAVRMQCGRCGDWWQVYGEPSGGGLAEVCECPGGLSDAVLGVWDRAAAAVFAAAGGTVRAW
jgi:hypothetical protein